MTTTEKVKNKDCQEKKVNKDEL